MSLSAALLALLPACAPLVHPDTISRVVAVESAGNPWAINVNGARLERQPRSLAEAVVTARALRRQGFDFDAGLGQINVRNWQWLGLDEISVFDPCTNLKATQTVLLDAFKRAPAANPQAALRQSLSAFNTGSFSAGFANGYVSKVVSAPASPQPSTKEQSP
ncbi:lytic transglycosylase domain-containing protein [Azohydromonas aeria]|uniref:lytic transglycosylase domain-containing protein n=1 Tax=Azohydromonas aeria TaxID=2590212 RepID=UPI001E322836|nr:lytic transglycosylase domain-containing protein [Azohydromonas aeria]